MGSWPIYRGELEPHDGIADLPDPPRWRTFEGSGESLDVPPERIDPTAARRLGDGEHWRKPSTDEIRMVNAALFLRRPLLVTGKPGTGKSTLPYQVARELKLGPVLRWPITSRSTLREGLYDYDPIGRLRDEHLRQARGRPASDDTEIGRHLRLGPLGTALLPYKRPRVLLIDEIDKSDIDLPNDLLNVFEEGQFLIDELARLSTGKKIEVPTADGGSPVAIRRGRVACEAFPFVVLTSNNEREFPKPLLRRCLRLDLKVPSAAQIADMVAAHIGPAEAEKSKRRIEQFRDKLERGDVATDQLLNAVFVATSAGDFDGLDDLIAKLLSPLSGAG
ncbi:AAA family ATPase [Nocardia bovistercoris]|uniref:AAA family ATPase n=1 Tax=Nocardia bovistercoris TaxID=2785916 RepID=A0A931I8V0_9NOCA|nr:AAA family ATPase [Nocardia bovistercoris]MBH0775503.1 AAA family ATPase [Nocardia bovistercoris]